MKINSIYLKNFKIFGPEGVTIDFSSDSELILVSGKNGFGKSSISAGIIYGLYGKNPEGNLSDLPNWMNPDDMQVIINIDARGSNIIIERSRHTFDITIDNQLWEQAGKSNMQDFLEQEYLDLPYYTFKNILILSINDFKSFLTMSPSDKRKIVDRIFGFSVINEMRDLNKKYLTTVFKELNDILIKVTQLEKNIKSSNEHLNEIKKENKKKNISKTKKIDLELTETKKELVNLKTQKNKLDDRKNKIEQKISEHLAQLNKLKYKINSIHEKKNLYKKDKCPMCNSDLDTEYHKKILEDCIEEEHTYNSKIEKIKRDLNLFEEKETDVYDKLKSVTTNINSLDSQLYNLKNKLEELTDIHKDTDKIDHVEKLIQDFKEDKKENVNTSKKKGKHERFYNIVDELLSDNGIKSIAIKTIIPKLNIYIQEEIRNMHLKYNAYFDENFDVILTYFGEKISANALSTGEKKKYDFVVLISILKLIKIKYQSLNLLFLDEVFSSIDSDGKYSILQILRTFIDEYNMSAAVINHSELPLQFFDKRIKLVNDTTYSTLEIEEI